MNRRELKRLDRELDGFLETMFAGLGRAERRAALRGYVTGLLLDGERKSIEPMAARLVDSPEEIEAMRQRLQQCVVVADWCDEELLRRMAVLIERELPGLEAFVVDDTGFPKKGKHSAGVARQYSGTLGRIDNCQVAVSLHLAGEENSVCIRLRLYLPEGWAADAVRRMEARIPEQVPFQKKWEIAISQLDDAIAWGLRKRIVLADAGYGDISEFRAALSARSLEYVTALSGAQTVWPPQSRPVLPSRRGEPGRPNTRWVDEKNPPVAITKFAETMKYRRVAWREGAQGWQASRFAAIRLRLAINRFHGAPPSELLWLIAEWPTHAAAPTKYWVSTLPENTPLRTLVRLAKLRWRVERDYQEMKQEVGLDHYEGRTWRGFHHHGTLCAVAHAFLALRRALFPPEAEMDAA